MDVENQSVQLTRNRIAALTPRDIARLSFDEMVEVVISSRITYNGPLPMDQLEGETLVRLVYSARNHCRTQTQ